MAHLVGYGMRAIGDNSYFGHLAKAQCDFCGRRYGTLEEAKQCENEHINNLISLNVGDLIMESMHNENLNN